MRDILRISVPITAWLAAFSAVYGLQGFLCSDHWGGGEWNGVAAGRVLLVAAWGAVIAIQAALLLALRSPRFASPRPFVRWVSNLLAAVALVAAVWTLFPVVATSRCL